MNRADRLLFRLLGLAILLTAAVNVAEAVCRWSEGWRERRRAEAHAAMLREIRAKMEERR